MTTILLILILVTGYSVFQIIGEIIRSNECPEESMLKKVIQGRMNRDSPTARNIIKHLGVCSDCRDKIDEFMGDKSD